MRIGLVSGIAGRGDSSLIRPVPDTETLPIYYRGISIYSEVSFIESLIQNRDFFLLQNIPGFF